MNEKFFFDRGYVACRIKYGEVNASPIQEGEDESIFSTTFFGFFNEETGEYEPVPEEVWEDYWKEFLPW